MNDGSGMKCVAFAEYSSRDGFWLRMYLDCYQQVMFEEHSLERFSETWPRSGMMRNGIAYRLPTLAPRIPGTESGFWATPEAHNQEGYQVSGGKRRLRLGAQVKMWPTPRANLITTATEAGANRDDSRLEDAVATTGDRGYLNPTWVEWLMGFPLGWTDLDA